MRWHSVPRVQGTDISTCGWGCGTTGGLIHFYWDCTTVWLPWKAVWQLIPKLTILLLYSLAVTFLGIYPKWTLRYLPKSLHTNVAEALLIIAKTQKQPRYFAVGEWINSGPCVQWSVIRQSKKWASKPWKIQRKRKCIWLSEQSQSKKAMDCVIPAIRHSGRGQATIETVGR